MRSLPQNIRDPVEAASTRKRLKMSKPCSQSVLFGFKERKERDCATLKMANINDERHTESEHSWTWVVKRCSKNFKMSYGSCRTSPTFIIGKFTFELRWYPGGFDYSTREYVGVFLKLREPSCEASIKFSVHIGFDTIKMFKMTKCEKNFQPRNENCSFYGDNKLVEREVLLDQVLKLSNDKLMIMCVIYGLDTTESHHRLLKLDGYGTFLNNEKLSDVNIVVGNKIIHAHKFVLVNGSKVFAAMFDHNMTENEEGIVKIDDVEYDVMFEILRYMYTGKVERIVHKTKELFVAADKYDLSDLKKTCRKYLCMNLCPDNFFDYLKFSELHEVTELTETAETFFSSRGGEVTDLQNFKESLVELDNSVTANLFRQAFKRPRLA
ncbi:hypothetical protein QAD02_001123 [Eretmocerus hayati]|uniref:Uncharacterized protein n=1 Tax=Eretmocerus hayati TaxID=131215 RepID=A0ACC2NF57_9HYME|nr:hypothetical protein QAD02_001123 [Eretmocerus hayati]